MSNHLLPLPAPKDPHGYTDGELRVLCTSLEEYQWLIRWLCGQTCTSNEAGQLLSYPWDVERGLALYRHGTPTHWD